MTEQLSTQLLLKIIDYINRNEIANEPLDFGLMESWMKDYGEAFALEKAMDAWKQQGVTRIRSTMDYCESKFIEIPGMAFDAVEQEQTGKHPDRCELMEIVVKIDRTRIEGYSETTPATEFKEDRKIWTRVHMQSGTEYLVNMPLAEFEKLLNP